MHAETEPKTHRPPLFRVKQQHSPQQLPRGPFLIRQHVLGVPFNDPFLNDIIFIKSLVVNEWICSSQPLAQQDPTRMYIGCWASVISALRATHRKREDLIFAVRKSVHSSRISYTCDEIGAYGEWSTFSHLYLLRTRKLRRAASTPHFLPLTTKCTKSKIGPKRLLVFIQ